MTPLHVSISIDCNYDWPLLPDFAMTGHYCPSQITIWLIVTDIITRQTDKKRRGLCCVACHTQSLSTEQNIRRLTKLQVTFICVSSLFFLGSFQSRRMKLPPSPPDPNSTGPPRKTGGLGGLIAKAITALVRPDRSSSHLGHVSPKFGSSFPWSVIVINEIWCHTTLGEICPPCCKGDNFLSMFYAILRAIIPPKHLSETGPRLLWLTSALFHSLQCQCFCTSLYRPIC
jgi:hypothetical protein